MANTDRCNIFLQYSINQQLNIAISNSINCHCKRLDKYKFHNSQDFSKRCLQWSFSEVAQLWGMFLWHQNHPWLAPGLIHTRSGGFWTLVSELSLKPCFIKHQNRRANTLFLLMFFFEILAVILGIEKTYVLKWDQGKNNRRKSVLGKESEESISGLSSFWEVSLWGNGRKLMLGKNWKASYMSSVHGQEFL